MGIITNIIKHTPFFNKVIQRCCLEAVYRAKLGKMVTVSDGWSKEHCSY